MRKAWQPDAEILGIQGSYGVITWKFCKVTYLKIIKSSVDVGEWRSSI